MQSQTIKTKCTEKKKTHNNCNRNINGASYLKVQISIEKDNLATVCAMWCSLFKSFVNRLYNPSRGFISDKIRAHRIKQKNKPRHKRMKIIDKTQ